jgi:hypothetical protein
MSVGVVQCLDGRIFTAQEVDRFREALRKCVERMEKDGCPEHWQHYHNDDVSCQYMDIVTEGKAALEQR